MPDLVRRWFGQFAPVITKSGATRATGATPAGKSSKTARSGATPLLPNGGNKWATEGNSAGLVAHVARVSPGVGNTSAALKSPENLALLHPVAHVARDAPEIESRTAALQEHEERVAIIAEGVGCPLEWVEGFAWLDPDRPPAAVPAARWLTFVDDCGRFIDDWAERAAELGWTALDLFGADRDCPLARFDRCGLLWLTNGDRIVALSDQTAVMETPTGAKLTYRRRPADGHMVVAWEMD